MIPASLVRAKRLVRTFRDAGALTRKTSVSLVELGVDDDVFFRRVAGEGVFVNTHGDAWYLDEERAGRYFGKRRRRMAVFVTIGLGLALLIAYAKGT